MASFRPFLAAILIEILLISANDAFLRSFYPHHEEETAATQGKYL